MRVRWFLSSALLALGLLSRPARAAEAPVAFQRDGTFFYSVRAELLAQQSAAKADSSESPKAALIAGGGVVVGLAALFVQYINDPVVLSTVNEVETLVTGLSGKIWQKITLLERVSPVRFNNL